MARKVVQTIPTLHSWEEVDNALKEILLTQSQINARELELTERITAAKEQLVAASKPLRERIALLEKQIRDYTGFHRVELQGKSRQLNFGAVGFRSSSSVLVPAEHLPEVIAALRTRHMEDCVAVKESVNKEVLRQYPLEDIQACGCTIRSSERFWYETSETELTDTAAERG